MEPDAPIDIVVPYVRADSWLSAALRGIPALSPGERRAVLRAVRRQLRTAGPLSPRLRVSVRRGGDRIEVEVSPPGGMPGIALLDAVCA